VLTSRLLLRKEHALHLTEAQPDNSQQLHRRENALNPPVAPSSSDRCRAADARLERLLAEQPSFRRPHHPRGLAPSASVRAALTSLLRHLPINAPRPGPDI
jgi:hypothetical protein